jgi:hypothetical protein
MNTAEEVDAVLDVLPEVVARLREDHLIASGD